MIRFIKFSTLLVMLVLFFGFSVTAQAKTFNPTTAAQLQADLTEAQANQQDDVINLAPNTIYSTRNNGDNAFLYVANAAPDENFSLTITGAGDGTTILDGMGSVGYTGILLLVTLGLTDDSQANIEVSGVTLQSGMGPIFINTNYGNIHLDNIELKLSTGPAQVQAANGDILVNQSLFEDNLGLLLGFLTSGGNVTFNNNIFSNNEKSQFQAYVNTETLRVDGNLIQDNYAENGLFITQTQSGNIILTNNIFEKNTVFSVFPSTTLIAGATSGSITLTNNTIYDNVGLQGIGGVYLSLNNNNATANLYNNIIYGNLVIDYITLPFSPDIYVNDDGDGDNVGSPVMLANNDYTTFTSACEDAGGCTPNVTKTANLTDRDPLFVDPSDGDLHLGVGSPCIGAGDPNAPDIPDTDFDGRALNNPPDLGALAALLTLVVDPANIDFGSISNEVPSSRTVTLTNSGALDLSVTGITLDDATNFAVGFGTCGSATFTLGGGESCTIEVTFDPSGSGDFTATVTISSDDPDNPTRTISLSGTGVSTGGCALGKGTSPFPTAALFLLIPMFFFARRVFLRR